jgi:hypothetical protein
MTTPDRPSYESGTVAWKHVLYPEFELAWQNPGRWIVAATLPTWLQARHAVERVTESPRPLPNGTYWLRAGMYLGDKSGRIYVKCLDQNTKFRLWTDPPGQMYPDDEEMLKIINNPAAIDS